MNAFDRKNRLKRVLKALIVGNFFMELGNLLVKSTTTCEGDHYFSKCSMSPSCDWLVSHTCVGLEHYNFSVHTQTYITDMFQKFTVWFDSNFETF